MANPAAGGGRGARLFPAVREQVLARGGDARLTTSAGEEVALAREAARGGADTIIALGGDGTWSHVARGILEARRDTRLALLAGGTGNDLARNVGAPAHEVRATLDLAFGTQSRRVDVGYAGAVPFLNCSGVGFDVAVLAAMAGGRSLGRLGYLATAARMLWRYRPAPAAIGDAQPQPYLVIVAGNGARFGGGMLVAPGAMNDDGALDLVAVTDMPVAARARTLAAAARGRHLGLAGVTHRRAATFSLTFAEPPLFQVDGEVLQSGSATLELRCEPGRLRLACPPPAA